MQAREKEKKMEEEERCRMEGTYSPVSGYLCKRQGDVSRHGSRSGLLSIRAAHLFEKDMHEACVKMDLVEFVAWSGSRSVTHGLKILIGWLAHPTSMQWWRGRLDVDGYDVGGDMAGRCNNGGTYCGLWILRLLA